MKEKIKKIKFLGKFLLNLRSFKVFNYDRKSFINNFINGTKTSETINYDLLLEIHKLEKGMTAKEVRPFGKDKVKKIISLLNEYDKRIYDKGFVYNLALSILFKYKTIYLENKWADKEEFILVDNYLSNYIDDKILECGSKTIEFNDIEEDLSIDYYKFLKSRHSVRNFKDVRLLDEDVERAVQMSILSPSACNRQMCKLYYIKNDNKKKVIEKYAKGLSLFELDNANYFVITFDLNSFYFIDERNQGWLNAGLFCMNFVNALHSLKIGSCIVQFANSPQEEEAFKEKLEIGKSERVAVIVVCGYYDNSSIIPVSKRKDINEILKVR